MSKTGWGKQGAALLRRRWLAREKKLAQERAPALDAKKAAIAARVRDRLQRAEHGQPDRPAEEKAADKGCAACPAHGCCELVECGEKEADRPWDKP